MKIILTEITKLHAGKCCVAGICREDGRLYRLSSPYVASEFISSNKWRVGTELEGTFIFEHPNDPVHCEDTRWCARKTGRIAEGTTLRHVFEKTTVESLPASLGIAEHLRGTPVDHFHPHGRSIVTIRPGFISIEKREPRRSGDKSSVRVEFYGAGIWMKDVPVTDVRFFNQDGTVDDNAIFVVQRHLDLVYQGGEDLFMRVGVTRPFDPSGEGNLCYWVQIDGLHFFRCDDGKYIRDFDIATLGSSDGATLMT